MDGWRLSFLNGGIGRTFYKKPGPNGNRVLSIIGRTKSEDTKLLTILVICFALHRLDLGGQGSASFELRYFLGLDLDGSPGLRVTTGTSGSF